MSELTEISPTPSVTVAEVGGPSRRGLLRGAGVLLSAAAVGGAAVTLGGPLMNGAEAALPGNPTRRWGDDMGLAIPAYDMMWGAGKGAKLGQTLDLAQGTGVHWVRTDLWLDSMMFQDPGKVYWDEADRVINAIHARGGKIILCPHTMPKYARKDPNNPRLGPTTPEQRRVYTNFLKQAVLRYKNVCKNYEIWNEPNLTQFWGVPNVDAYGQLLKESYNVIKSVDKGAYVISGGTGGANPAAKDIDALVWVHELYERGYLKKYSNEVAIHAYTNSAAGNLGEFYRLNEYRKIMDANGDYVKKLMITEGGSHVIPGNRVATEANQAKLFPQAAEAWSKVHHRGPMMWFSLYNNNNDYCGIIKDDRKTKRSAYSALAKISERVG